MSEKTVLHVIDSLGTGGAESLLVNANIHLPGFQHHLVYLKKVNVYQDQLTQTPTTCLNFRGWSSLPKAVQQLKKLIKQHSVHLVHSHLYYATIVARLACPRKVPLVTSYHSLLYHPKNTAQYSRKLLLLDQLTYRSRYQLLFVSQAVQALVCRQVGVKHNYEVLPNYVDEPYYSTGILPERQPSSQLRMVMVGNLRPEKNYAMVIQAMCQSVDCQLDIYGEGSQRAELESLINQYQLQKKVHLKGRTEQPYAVLPDYDLYIAASRFEGFGIALAEAMAAGLPCLVSDIAAHREVAGDTVMYFDPDDPESLKDKISLLFKTPQKMNQLRSLSRQRAETFRKNSYMKKLVTIYEKVLSDKVEILK